VLYTEHGLGVRSSRVLQVRTEQHQKDNTSSPRPWIPLTFTPVQRLNTTVSITKNLLSAYENTTYTRNLFE
jgi:hypothetical protein